MIRVAGMMKLLPGFQNEYKKRHDKIWPELKSLLLSKGIDDYSIFLDEETNLLFACLTVDDPAHLEELPACDLMKKWWSYMKDIMQTNEDNSPVYIPLKEMFYLSGRQ
jgi:L-rhamnose mutarotase